MVRIRDVAYVVVIGAVISGTAYLTFMICDAESTRPTAPPYVNTPEEASAGMDARKAELTWLRSK